VGHDDDNEKLDGMSRAAGSAMVGLGGRWPGLDDGSAPADASISA
jgi:hypothetical protein